MLTLTGGEITKQLSRVEWMRCMRESQPEREYRLAIGGHREIIGGTGPDAAGWGEVVESEEVCYSQ